MEQISRRNFIIAGSAAVGGIILNGCGNPEQQQLPPTADSPQQLSQNTPVDGPAEGPFAPAVRGEQVQINPPPGPPKNWVEGERYTHVLVNELLNSYTFDDGPSPYNTEPILRTLAQYGIKATFFVVGVNVRAWPEILQRIVNEGHEIGNHSVYHSPYESLALANQIGPNQQIIQETVGLRPVANRAPGLTQGAAILNACRGQGMYELHTHMDTNDWRGDPRLSASQLYSEHARVYKNGGFWLYHDGGNARPTPAALPSMIDFDRSRGVKLLTATNLMNSGIPLPGRSAFSALETNDSRITQSELEEQPLVGTTCNYDPKEELLRRFNDVHVKGPERDRIGDVLEDIRKMEKAS